MSKVHAGSGSATDSSVLTPRPLVTRGLRREQEKRKRRRLRVPRDTLVLGIDLARERQAASFSHDGQVLGRRRLNCGAQEIDRLFPEATALAEAHGLSHVVVAFEPAGLYWGLAAETCERAGIECEPWAHALISSGTAHDTGRWPHDALSPSRPARQLRAPVPPSLRSSPPVGR